MPMQPRKDAMMKGDDDARGGRLKTRGKSAHGRRINREA